MRNDLNVVVVTHWIAFQHKSDGRGAGRVARGPQRAPQRGRRSVPTGASRCALPEYKSDRGLDGFKS